MKTRWIPPAMLDGITDSLIFRMYYLTPFTQTRISDDYLNMITNDMKVMRDAGKKAIVRFAYKDDFSDNDASLVQVMEHLDQLEDRLRDNSDVIAVLQAGFIGSWGEWHNGHPDFGNPDPNWSARRQIVTRLLEILPPSRMIQLRTPGYKYHIFSDTVTYSNSIPFPVPLAESQAHSGSDVARTGHHNDCFLCNPSDAGTYVYTPTEYPYLQQETEYVGMGGETGDYHECSDYDSDRLECETAMQELEWFHSLFARS